MIEPTGVVLDASWLSHMHSWLTDPHTNRMARVGPVTADGQRQWLEQLPGREDYWVRGLVVDGQKVGAFGLKYISAYAAEVFCYVGPAAERGRGLGRWCLLRCEDEAAHRGLVRLWGIVADFNEASRKMLRGLGYVTVGPHGDDGLFIEKLVPGRKVGGPP